MVTCALDAKNVSLQLCANIMIIILAEAFLFSFPSRSFSPLVQVLSLCWAKKEKRPSVLDLL